MFALVAQPMYGMVASQVANAAKGTTFYVDRNGSDNSGCGEASGSDACATIQKAIDEAGDGDTVFVNPGTYYEDKVTIDKDITLKAANTDSILKGKITVVSAGSGATIQSLKINSNVDDEYAVGIIDADNVTVHNNTISGTHTTKAKTSAKAIYVGGGDVSGTVIRNNYISAVKSDQWGGYGILFSKKNFTNTKVYDNTLHNISGVWATAIGLEGNTPDAVVTGNKITSLSSSGYPTSTAVKFEDNPSAKTVEVTGLYDGKEVTNSSQNVAVDAIWPENPANPEVLSKDGVYRYIGHNAFSTIQDGLDAVAEYGTVNVADGLYTGSAKFKTSNTALVGESKNGTKLQVKSNTEGGIYAKDLSNIAIKELSMYAPAGKVAPTSMIKLVNGDTATVWHVDIHAGGARTTGVDVNSFSNTTLHNVAVNNAGKDGLSVSAKYSDDFSHSSDNITLKDVDIKNAAWSGYAFYTTSSKGLSTDITGVTFGKGSTIEGGDRSIYFEGLKGSAITGVDGSPVDLNNVKMSNPSQQFVVNEQSGDVLATNATFDGQLGKNMNTQEQTTLDGKIVDAKDNKELGRVVYDEVAPAVLINPVDVDSPYSFSGEVTGFDVHNVTINFYELHANGTAVKVDGKQISIHSAPVDLSEDGTWTYEIPEADRAKFKDGTKYRVNVRAFDHNKNTDATAVSYKHTTPVVFKNEDKKEKDEKTPAAPARRLGSPTVDIAATPVQASGNLLAPNFAVANQNNETDEDATTESDDSGILGAAETTSPLANTAAVAGDSTKSGIIGLAWYWWLLILAAVVGTIWYLIAAARRNNQSA